MKEKTQMMLTILSIMRRRRHLLPPPPLRISQQSSIMRSTSSFSLHVRQNRITQQEQSILKGQRAMHTFSNIVQGGTGEVLLTNRKRSDYRNDGEEEKVKTNRSSSSTTTRTTSSEASTRHSTDSLLSLASTLRESFWTRGYAHVPNFLNVNVVSEMTKEACMFLTDGQGREQHQAVGLEEEPFYSTESHTVYQEEHDPNYDGIHPRNVLQQSSKWIIDYAKLPTTTPLKTLYTSSEFRSFISYIVSSPDHKEVQELYLSGCPYNAAYYNVYQEKDGLGWHFDRSSFGVNLELQLADKGGNFEIVFNTRNVEKDPWNFDKVQQILSMKDDATDRSSLIETITTPTVVGPGSLVIFSGSQHLHRVTPVQGSTPRINAIMTYELTPNQTMNAYSLRKFFGR